ncbi:MAG: dihydrofolate reductase [Erythrobacter sp.]|nr:MAG: dihydrofolate reductase [Erythrobacter sp.]
MPRKITGAAFLSLDGVMQAPGGPDEDTTGGFEHGGWFAALFEEAIGHQVDTVFKPPFDLLLGRRTYDIFAAHWPALADDGEIGTLFAGISKYVLTSSDEPLAWQGSHALADIDAVAALKENGGPDLVIQGSSTLYPPLLARGLIDRLVLMVAPVVLGSGKRLFGANTDGSTGAGAWKLVEQRQTPGGTLMSTYEPDGQVKIADFQLPDPTPEELARQQRMREGTW